MVKLAGISQPVQNAADEDYIRKAMFDAAAMRRKEAMRGQGAGLTTGLPMQATGDRPAVQQVAAPVAVDSAPRRTIGNDFGDNIPTPRRPYGGAEAPPPQVGVATEPTLSEIAAEGRQKTADRWVGKILPVLQEHFGPPGVTPAAPPPKPPTGVPLAPRPAAAGTQPPTAPEPVVVAQRIRDSASKTALVRKYSQRIPGLVNQATQPNTRQKANIWLARNYAGDHDVPAEIALAVLAAESDYGEKDPKNVMRVSQAARQMVNNTYGDVVQVDPKDTYGGDSTLAGILYMKYLHDVENIPWDDVAVAFFAGPGAYKRGDALITTGGRSDQIGSAYKLLTDSLTQHFRNVSGKTPSTAPSKPLPPAKDVPVRTTVAQAKAELPKVIEEGAAAAGVAVGRKKTKTQELLTASPSRKLVEPKIIPEMFNTELIAARDASADLQRRIALAEASGNWAQASELETMAVQARAIVLSVAQQKAINQLKVSGDGRLLAQIWSRKSGQHHVLQPRSDGQWNIIVDGQLVNTLSKNDIVSSARTSASNEWQKAVEAAQAIRVGKRDEAGWEIQKVILGKMWDAMSAKEKAIAEAENKVVFDGAERPWLMRDGVPFMLLEREKESPTGEKVPAFTPISGGVKPHDGAGLVSSTANAFSAYFDIRG